MRDLSPQRPPVRVSLLAAVCAAGLAVTTPVLGQGPTRGEGPREGGRRGRSEEPPPPVAETPAGSAAWRELGPTLFGGRIVDLAIHPDRPAHLWVAAASGGLWLSENHGTTWRCIFEREGAATIGDIAVDPRDPDVVWVGTGEANNQRSSYWGDGVYRTADGGKTWTNVGLRDSHHIGRVVVDPVDSQKVFVAAAGHLYTENDERGLYRTLDGGATWERVLFVDRRTGVIDVVVDPTDPRFVYAATYERLRRPWHLDESGPTSGIWRSEDGGATFTRCAGGLPEGEIGRIGLDVFAGDPRIVYATVSNMNRVPVEEERAHGFTAAFDEGRVVVRSVQDGGGAQELGLAVGDVLVMLGDVKLDTPFQWLGVLARVEAEAAEAKDAELQLVRRRGDDEATFPVTLTKLFRVAPREPRTREVGGEIYRSEDHGVTWARVNEKPVGGDPPVLLRPDPRRPDGPRHGLRAVGAGLQVADGGKTWTERGSSARLRRACTSTTTRCGSTRGRTQTLRCSATTAASHITWDGGETGIT
jgi:photosystem II stability/assembly factor-like uncharacterized protein